MYISTDSISRNHRLSISTQKKSIICNLILSDLTGCPCTNISTWLARRNLIGCCRNWVKNYALSLYIIIIDMKKRKQDPKCGDHPLRFVSFSNVLRYTSTSISVVNLGTCTVLLVIRGLLAVLRFKRSRSTVKRSLQL